MKIPFLVGWTSINPSYFDVNYRGTRFWPIPKWPNVCFFSSENREILEITARVIDGSEAMSQGIWGFLPDKSPISRFKAKYSFVNPSLGWYSKFGTLYQFLRFLSPFFGYFILLPYGSLGQMYRKMWKKTQKVKHHGKMILKWRIFGHRQVSPSEVRHSHPWRMCQWM